MPFFLFGKRHRLLVALSGFEQRACNKRLGREREGTRAECGSSDGARSCVPSFRFLFQHSLEIPAPFLAKFIEGGIPVNGSGVGDLLFKIGESATCRYD